MICNCLAKRFSMFCEHVECVQKCACLIDLKKCCKMSSYLQNRLRYSRERALQRFFFFERYEPRAVGTPRQVGVPRQNSPVASFLEKLTKKIRENKQHLVPRPFTLNNNDQKYRMVFRLLLPFLKRIKIELQYFCPAPNSKFG